MDIEQYCKVNVCDSKEELDKKYKAFQHEINDNKLYIDLHDYRFKFERKIIEAKNKDTSFTHDKYIEYLSKLKQTHHFVDFTSASDNEDLQVIWRHDIDASVHDAYKLALIEHELGVKSTYFVLLYSWFYDIRDPEVHGILKEIKSLGHEVALHFDFQYVTAGNIQTLCDFERALKLQKQELEQLLGISINAFSFHNPTTISNKLLQTLNKNLYHLDMINVYNEKFTSIFKYCSDSNGIWRHGSLENLLYPNPVTKLHVLTHPEWWSKDPISPCNKIQSIVFSRATGVLSRYDTLLADYNRPNK